MVRFDGDWPDLMADLADVHAVLHKEKLYVRIANSQGKFFQY